MSREIIAMLRGAQPDEVEGIGAALLDNGITKTEVPLNSPDPFNCIEKLAHA